MRMMNIFNRRKRREEELNAKEGFLQNTLLKTTNIQETNADVQKQSMEIAWKNQLLNEEIKNLVIENERTKNILLERELFIKKQLNELEERIQVVRREEIILETKKSDLRRKSHESDINQKQIEKERKFIKEREEQSDKIKKEAEEAKLKYEKLNIDLKNEREEAINFQKELENKYKDVERKNAEANTIFEKAKTIDEEIKRKEEVFEIERKKIEAALKEKLEVVDRRLADMDNLKGIVDDIKYDHSEEGKFAKIVVKEAIRKAKNMLTDIKAEFDLLDEKYASGTFKGFSTPITEIDNCFEELKSQYQEIKEHISSNTDLPTSITKWIEIIEEYIIKADTSLKSWEFSEAFRSISFGLATCKNYELLLQVLFAWANGENEETSTEVPDDFTDWYEILEVKFDANIDEIKRQRNILVKKYHPDFANDETREEYTIKTALINEAYDILSDTIKRKEFDIKRNNYKKQKS